MFLRGSRYSSLSADPCGMVRASELFNCSAHLKPTYHQMQHSLHTKPSPISTTNLPCALVDGRTRSEARIPGAVSPFLGDSSQPSCRSDVIGRITNPVTLRLCISPPFPTCNSIAMTIKRRVRTNSFSLEWAESRFQDSRQSLIAVLR
jgi:hypothetical protein